MPEGPELHLASKFVNHVCKGLVFSGKIVKSPVHKCAEVNWDYGDFKISATSRGKEMKLTLSSVPLISDDSKKLVKNSESEKTLDILFTFGMSGRFNFCEETDMEKHSHLNFYTKVEKDSTPQVLSFVDYRRFGKWIVGSDWSPDRGPCVLLEYPAFRQNVLDRLEDTAFSKPICEVMLNQKYFNGIGNYLRAEVLYRLGIQPFECARTVLEKLVAVGEDGKKVAVKSETPDILELCHQLPLEVVNIGATAYGLYSEKSYTSFTDWLQCYYQPNMKNMADHNKRTIWFSGDPGPLVPKEQKVRRSNKPPKNKKRKPEAAPETENGQTESDESPSKKEKMGKRITRAKLKEAGKKDSKAKPSKTHKIKDIKLNSKTAGPKTKRKDAGPKMKDVDSDTEKDTGDVLAKTKSKSARRKSKNPKIVLIGQGESGMIVKTVNDTNVKSVNTTIEKKRVNRLRRSTRSSSKDSISS